MKPSSEDCWICQSLKKDRHLVFYETKTSTAKLNPDQYFLGYSFVVFRKHEVELYDISDEERKEFLEDMSNVARALALAFKPDKMNYELLGTGQPHMHWQLVQRYRWDPFWRRPIWTSGTKRKRLGQEDYPGIVSRLQTHLQ